MSNSWDARRTATEQPANFAGALGGMYGSYGQGFGTLGQGLASGYGGLSQGNAMAEAARQGALSNIASSMLSNYGAAANQAFGAYAGQQTAYMKALSDMHNTNQAMVSQLGQSRNNALAGLSDAYSNAGSGLGRAAAVGDLDLNFSSSDSYGGGGGSISANDGDVLQGTYGWPDSSGGGSSMSLTASRSSDNRMVPEVAGQTFGGLAATGASLNSPEYLMSLRADGQSGLDRLDAQQYSSRYTPFQVLEGLYPQMMNMGGMGVAASGSGMNQFYGNQGGVLRGLDDTGRDIADRMSGSLDQGSGEITGLFNDSIGQLPYFMSPAERERQRQEYERERERSQYVQWDRYLAMGMPHLVPAWYKVPVPASR